MTSNYNVFYLARLDSKIISFQCSGIQQETLGNKFDEGNRNSIHKEASIILYYYQILLDQCLHILKIQVVQRVDEFKQVFSQLL